MKRWYVVHTHASAEALAKQHLTRQGFNVFLPRYRKLRRHARRVDRVLAPLFPRYLFVNMDLSNERWRAILSTVGVARLICHGDIPAPVPERVVEEIQTRMGDDGAVSMFSGSGMVPGDEVRIVDGAFSDRTGIFKCLDDKQRVVVLLDLLGRELWVRLDPGVVAAA